jgi:F-type H+-transporting ATPase subunit epsilon
VAESHPKFDVALVTPDGAAFDGEAEMVIVPGAAGEIGVLARHAPLVATLKSGSTRIHLSPNEVLEFATGPGFFKVELDRALALVDDAVSVKEIDDARARGQLRPRRRSSRSSRPATRRPIAGSSAAHQARREPALRFRSNHG